MGANAKNVTPIFKKADNEHFLVRITAEKFINELNRYSKNPFEVETTTTLRSKVPYFPINWDFDQFYLFLYSFFTRNVNNGKTMIFTVNESQVVDWFLVIPNKQETNLSESPLKFEIHFTIEDVPKNEITVKFVEVLNDYIKNYDPILDLNAKLMELCKALGLDIDYYFFLPFDLIDFMAGMKVPAFNDDLSDYFVKNIAWFDYFYLKPIDYFDPLKISLKLNPTFFGFHVLKNMTDTADIIPIKELADYLVEFLEGREFNILLLDNGIPFILAHTIVENHKLKLYPVSFSSLKGSNWLTIKDWNEMYDFLSKKTGRDSIILEINDIARIANDYQERRTTTLEMCLEVFTMIYSAPCAHQYTMSKFFEIFGFRLDEGIKNFNSKFKLMVNLLESVLLVLIDARNKGKEILHIMEIYATEDEHIHFQFLQHRALKPYKYNGLETLKEIKMDCQLETKRKYNIVFGIKLNDLKNTLSAEKMSEIIGIKNFYTQLPAVSSIFALILSMKLYDEDRFHPEKPLLKNVLAPKSDELKIFTSDIKNFLANGIFVLTEKGFPLKSIRSETGQRSGLFGFDFEKILKKMNQES